MNFISDSTKVPLGLALAVIGGGAGWLTNIAFQTNANAKTLEVMEKKHDLYLESLQRIETDLAVVRGKVEWIERHSKERE
jgi:hypothetical protein